MSREIKFRGIGINTNEWAYGDYCTIPSSNILFKNENNEVDCEPIEAETVGQYTGLKDKNDKEIYEGDIVKYIYAIDGLGTHNCYTSGTIEYGQTGFKFNGKKIKNFLCDLPGFCVAYSQEYVEVIGNIYENPELLKGED